jgi:hypothetical protein
MKKTIFRFFSLLTQINSRYNMQYIPPISLNMTSIVEVFPGSKQGSYWIKGSAWLGWSHHHDLVDHYGISVSWLITGFVTKLTKRVALVEQELPTHPEHMSSRPVFSGVPVPRSLDLCVCFVDRCLSFCPFCFSHCVLCSSSIYGFWLPFWYLQTLLRHEICVSVCRYILIWQFCNKAILYYFISDLVV